MLLILQTRALFAMHSAQVTDWGQPPKYVEIKTPKIPDRKCGLVQIRVVAVGCHKLVRARAAGTHYAIDTLPHTPGVDGVGTTEDGRLVYFTTFATGGSFSEVVIVPEEDVVLLPPGVDVAQAAAFVNPGLSSWMAIRTRTTNLPPNFSILIMGATSASGMIAIPLARAMGAGKVMGCARNSAALSVLDLDEAIPLVDPLEETDFSSVGNVDCILDYIYGPPALQLLLSLKSASPVQYVQMGCLESLSMHVPGSLLRLKNLTIRGSGPGSFSVEELRNEIPRLLSAIRSIKRSVKVVPFSNVEEAWNSSSASESIVFDMKRKA